MRLFIAVIPPAEVLGELADVVRPLAGAGERDGLRWTGEQGRHITLAFLGEVDEAKLPELHRRLAAAAGCHDPVPLRLAGGGRFGESVLWTGVVGAEVPGESEALFRLAASVAARARRCGIPPEGRAYRPHLTLARNRGAGSLDRYEEALAGFRGRSWNADRVELVRSHDRLPGAQPCYEVVAGWPLGR